VRRKITVFRLIGIAMLGVAAPLFGSLQLSVPDTAVGRNLQTSSAVVLSEAAPEQGLEVTIRSSDVSRLLLSRSPLEKGSETLTFRVSPGVRVTPEFWLQSLSDRGTATCSASAAGIPTAVSTVVLSPSAVIVSGPLRAPAFQATARGPAIKLTLTTVRLDASLNVAEEQLLALFPSIEIALRSSDSRAGTLSNTKVPIRAATSSAWLEFQPGAEGETDIAVAAPSGFAAPAQSAKVSASIRLPGLAISDQLTIGHDLQVGGVLSLGAASPPSGVAVTLTSGDPEMLLISDSPTRIGSPSLTLNIPAGAATGRYYLQALAGTGVVTYKAAAKGYRERTGTVTLAPAGIVLTPASQGPPDEAHVLRKDGAPESSVASAGVRKGGKTTLVAWTVQLDPATHRSADITVQPLRAGRVVKVTLTNSDPRVGKVPSTLVIAGGAEHAAATFEARRAGTTMIAVETPQGFTFSANSTSVQTVVTNDGDLRELRNESVRTAPRVPVR
jgi:hypothetical protein